MASVVTNYNLADIQRMLDIYYSNYFFDNKEILSYMANIDKLGGDDFEMACKKVLKLDLKTNYFIEKKVDNTIANTTIYNNTTDMIIALKIITNILYDIVNKTEADIYKNIKIIELNRGEPSDSITNTNETFTELFQQHDANTVSTNTDSTLENVPIRRQINIKYVVEGGILKVYNMNLIRPGTTDNYIFAKDINLIVINNQTYKYDFISNTGESILKNYVYFLTSFKEYNLKSQLHAFYYYIKLLHHFVEFYYHTERLLLNGVSGNMCFYFNNLYATELRQLKSNVDDIVKSSGEKSKLFNIQVKCKGTCPVVLEIVSLTDYGKNIIDMQSSKGVFKSDLIIDNGIIFNDDYVIIYKNETYEILTTTYSKIEGNNKQRKVTTITIKGITENVACQNRAKYPIMKDIELNEIVNIYLRKKTMTDIRRDYFNIGTDLKTINLDLRKTKDKLNSQVQKYEQQKALVNWVNIRSYIYYVIFISILITFVTHYFIEFDILTKQKIAIAIFIIVLILVSVNYFINYDYIERFKVIENFNVNITPGNIRFYTSTNKTGNEFDTISYSSSGEGSKIYGKDNIKKFSGVKSIDIPNDVGITIYSLKSSGYEPLIIDLTNKSSNINNLTYNWDNYSEIGVTIYPISPSSSDSMNQIQESSKDRRILSELTTNNTNCDQLTPTSANNLRNTFASNQITIFTEYVKDIFISYHIYLSTLDASDLFRKVSGSMKNEKKTFNEHREIYKYKKDINDKSIDIMKHEMILKTAIINMLTLTFLIIAAIYLAYTYKPEFIKVYLYIGGIFGIFNIYIFFKTIIQPTRTRARNAYWYNVAESIARKMSY